jgi:enoyl-CoA hydratase/carnithine racemase
VLAEAIENPMTDDAARVIVLTGAGNTFCSDGDVSTMRRQGAEGTRTRTLPAQRVIMAIWNGPKPVLAAVEGYAVGAGAALALAFAIGFTRVGVAGDMGIFASLPARAGVGLARQLVLLPRRPTAQEARLSLGWRTACRVP